MVDGLAVGWLNFNTLIDSLMTRVRSIKMSLFNFTMYFNEVHDCTCIVFVLKLIIH